MRLKNNVRTTWYTVLSKTLILGLPLMATLASQVVHAQAKSSFALGAEIIEQPSPELKRKFIERLKALDALYLEAKSDKKARALLGSYVDTNLNFASDCILKAGYPDVIGKEKGYLSSGVYSAMDSHEAPKLCERWAEYGFKDAICSVVYIFRPQALSTELKQRSGHLQVEPDLVEKASDPKAIPLRVPVRAYYSCKQAKTMQSGDGGSFATTLGKHETLFSFDSTLEVISPFELQQYTNGTTAKTAMAHISPVSLRIMEFMAWTKPFGVPLIDRKPQISSR